jgi:hypothetical protein
MYTPSSNFQNGALDRFLLLINAMKFRVFWGAIFFSTLSMGGA